MTMHDIEVKSSQIAKAGYDRAAKLLELHFKSGGIYHYYDVSPQEYHALMRADSVGKHFHAHIRNAKAYRRIEK